MSTLDMEILSYFKQSEYIPAPSGMMTVWYSNCLKLKSLGLMEMISVQFEADTPLFVCKTTSKGRKQILNKFSTKS